MIDLLRMNVLKRQRLSSVLGLALDGNRLDGVVLRRNNGSLQVLESFSVSLSLDPLTADAELVGREIRNHLDAAGVHERRCIVGVPLKWALTAHADVPDLPEADVASFLQIEAERGFPCDVETLHFSTSVCHAPSGKRHAALVGIPRTHLARLGQALHAAKLKPVSFSLGIAALQPTHAESSNGVLALVVGEAHVGLQLTSGGGVAALRTLESALETDPGGRKLHADVVAREARITLGQLPAELRDSVRRIRIFGPRDLAQQLADELDLRFEPAGLKVEIISRYAADEFGLHFPPEAPVSPAFSLAAGLLAGRPKTFEFLPPRITALQQFATRYSSGRLRMAGAAAAAALLLLAGLFGWQQWQLSRLRAEWRGMSPKVGELQKLQDQIRLFRPWFDDQMRGLSILRQIANAFPDDGVVSAKTVEIRDLNAVTCTGIARDHPALMKTMEKLSSAPGVTDFHEGPIRGTSPIQFTFTFSWNEGGSSAN
jgi:hypothetical protein